MNTIHFGHGKHLRYGNLVLCIITLMSVAFLSSCEGFVKKINYSYEELSEDLVSIQVCKFSEDNVKDFGVKKCEMTVISTIESKEEIAEILTAFSSVDIRAVFGRPSGKYNLYGILLNYPTKHMFFSGCKIFALDSDYLINSEKEIGYAYDIGDARQADEYYEILEKYGCFVDYFVY